MIGKGVNLITFMKKNIQKFGYLVSTRYDRSNQIQELPTQSSGLVKPGNIESAAVERFVSRQSNYFQALQHITNFYERELETSSESSEVSVSDTIRSQETNSDNLKTSSTSFGDLVPKQNLSSNIELGWGVKLNLPFLNQNITIGPHWSVNPWQYKTIENFISPSNAKILFTINGNSSTKPELHFGGNVTYKNYELEIEKNVLSNHFFKNNSFAKIKTKKMAKNGLSLGIDVKKEKSHISILGPVGYENSLNSKLLDNIQINKQI